jgi:hypothetical protein
MFGSIKIGNVSGRHNVLADATLLALLLAVLTAPHACAYIDATTGSYMFEMLLGTLLTLSFSVKVFWRNLKLKVAKDNQ